MSLNLRRTCLWVLVSAAAMGRAAAQGTPPEGTLVLDESCYWRMYVVPGMMRLSGDVLKNEGKKWLDDALMARLEKQVKKHLDDKGYDWAKTDWRDVAVVHFLTTDPDNTRAMEIVPSIYPPKQWAEPGFDDTGWLRQRITQLPHDRPQLWPDLFNRAIFLRTTFQVADPAKVKELILNMAYRGGVRILINGKELKRASLPAGELPEEAKGDDYPEDAYRAYIDEVTDPQTGRRVIPDLRMPFHRAPHDEKNPKLSQYRYAHSHIWVNEKGWDRMVKLRDRELGDVSVPGSMLVKGVNVLAIEVRGSHYHPIIYPGAGGERFNNGNWRQGGGFENYTWAHTRLIRMGLTDPASAVASTLQRPEGVQVWVEDMHNRTYPQDFNQPGGATGKLRMVGAPNGCYGGQFVVGASKDLAGLKIAVGEVKSDKATLPADAFGLQAMVPEPLADIYKCGYGRGVDVGPVNEMTMHTVLQLSKNPGLFKAEIGGVVGEEMKKFQYFDHLSEALPASVKAGASQPFWLSLKIPEGTAPGVYRGSVTVSAEGMEPSSVPVEVEVIDWRVPGAGEFQTDVLLTQSLYAYPKQYKVPLFSDQHFKLMESAFKQLARVGNDCLYVPVLLRSEFGNVEQPGPIKWIRRKDGSLTFDYTNLDKYLDLAVKHMGVPRVISFGVMHWCMASSPPKVWVYDEATGKEEMVGMGWRDNAAERIPMWKAFANQLVDHMRAKGLYGSMYWGHGGDAESDPALIGLLFELYPDIYWTASTHSYGGGSGGGGHEARVFRCVSEIYAKPYTETSYKGWLRRGGDQKFFNPLSDRNRSSGMAVPFCFRTSADYSMHLGYTGIGGMGYDYYALSWNEGYGGTDWNVAGLPFFTLSWPGKGGAESSARFEAMLEGIQDAELRIFIEQQLERKALPDELAKQAQAAVLDRYRAFLTRQFNFSPLAQNGVGWQDYSRKAYQAAAAAAQKVGIDVFRTAVAAEVPALGKQTVTVNLRNWTNKSRSWKAAASDAWIVPEKTEGQLTGHQALKITLDASAGKAGAELKGTLTVTDVEAGASMPVQIAAKLTEAMDVRFDHAAFNCDVGQSQTRDFRVVNYAATPQKWSLACSGPWIKVEPGEGTLEPGASTFVKLTASPAEKQAAILESTFTFTGAGGAVKKEIKSRTFVRTPYQAPPGLPFGRVTKIEKMDPKLVKSHKLLAKGDALYLGRGESDRKQTAPIFAEKYREISALIGKKKLDRGMWVLPLHETTYNLEGKDFTAFAAYVGVPVDAGKSVIRHHERLVNFEIWVDGQLKAQSGLMKTTDEPRLLVADLTGAKEVKLLTRLDSDGDNAYYLVAWCNAEFYGK